MHLELQKYQKPEYKQKNSMNSKFTENNVSKYQKIMSRDLVCFVFLLQDRVGVKSYLGLGSSHFLETGLRILQVTFLTGSDLWEEEENKICSSTFL